jgi:hypothetical protein
MTCAFGGAGLLLQADSPSAMAGTNAIATNQDSHIDD